MRERDLKTEKEIWDYYNGMGRSICLFLFGCMLVLIAFGLRWLAYQ